MSVTKKKLIVDVVDEGIWVIGPTTLAFMNEIRIVIHCYAPLTITRWSKVTDNDKEQL